MLKAATAHQTLTIEPKRQDRRTPIIAVKAMATATTTNILIFGATGLIGTHITSAILSAAPKHEWSVAIFTSPGTVSSKASLISDLKGRGAKIIQGDFTNEADVKAAYSGIDTIVSCLGRPVIDKQILLVQVADEHPDVKRFLPSEYGTDIEYGPQSKDEKPHQMKIKVRAAIRAAKNLEHSFVVTGPYGDADKGLYLSAAPEAMREGGTYDVKNKKAVLIGDGEGKISLTTMRDVGKLVVATLFHPDTAKNKALKVNSFTTTPKELVAEFERQTGGKWDLSFTSLEHLKKMEKEAWEKGSPVAGGFTLRRIWAEGGTLYEKRDNGVIGMEEGVDDLRSCVQQAVEVQSREGAKM